MQLILSPILRGLLAAWLAVTLINGSQWISEEGLVFIVQKISPLSLQQEIAPSPPLLTITGAIKVDEAQEHLL